MVKFSIYLNRRVFVMSSLCQISCCLVQEEVFTYCNSFGSHHHTVTLTDQGTRATKGGVGCVCGGGGCGAYNQSDIYRPLFTTRNQSCGKVNK